MGSLVGAGDHVLIFPCVVLCASPFSHLTLFPLSPLLHHSLLSPHCSLPPAVSPLTTLPFSPLSLPLGTLSHLPLSPSHFSPLSPVSPTVTETPVANPLSPLHFLTHDSPCLTHHYLRQCLFSIPPLSHTPFAPLPHPLLSLSLTTLFSTSPLTPLSPSLRQ